MRHECAPKPWRETENLTGDYDLDATIAHRKNPSLPGKLAMYTMKPQGVYEPKTAYSPYNGMNGDD